ncbi:MAG TPA: hypothetical protein VK196_18190 [Magnetospirillum sp.]|nr:hypothetical protein [Magnetospirillum sp.]
MTKHHLLIIDQDLVAAVDWGIIATAIRKSRIRFRRLMKNRYPGDLIWEGRTADDLLNGYIKFLRHSVAQGFFLHPLILSTSELVQLKLVTGDTAIFPHGTANSTAMEFSEIRDTIVAAFVTHEIDCHREVLRQRLMELNDLTGALSLADYERIRSALWRRCSGDSDYQEAA